MTLSENCNELKQRLQIKYELTDMENYMCVNFIYMYMCEFRYAHKMYMCKDNLNMSLFIQSHRIKY